AEHAWPRRSRARSASRPGSSVRRCGGESWPGHGSGRAQLPRDDLSERLRGTLPVVVLDHVVEVARLLELPLRHRDAPPDLARALRGGLAQPALELVNRGGDEDRDGAGGAPLPALRALRLELEQRRLPAAPQAIDLRMKRAVAVPDVVDVLEELPGLDPSVELDTIEEPVVDAVLLARALLARRGGDGGRQVREPRQDELDQRALAGARRPRDDEDRLRSGG